MTRPASRAIDKRWETGGGGSLIGKGCHPLGAASSLSTSLFEGINEGSDEI